MTTISLIVPCFNEAENIPSLVTNIKNVFENSKYLRRILI